MNDTKNLVQKIVEGIQEKKGKNIVVADLTAIHDTICKYFVICQGNGHRRTGQCPVGGHGLFGCHRTRLPARGTRVLQSGEPVGRCQVGEDCGFGLKLMCQCANVPMC